MEKGSREGWEIDIYGEEVREKTWAGRTSHSQHTNLRWETRPSAV